ncbi:MAG: acetate--CoA ligase family protein [Trebonia sp.]
MTGARRGRDLAGADLTALLDPRRIALVGVSERPDRAASRPLRFLRDGGFSGDVYPVSASRTSVGGSRAWPSLSALPEVPDHAFIMVGADSVAGVVTECADLGIPVATVLSDGFAGTGTVATARRAALLSAAGPGRVRVLGPSSLGLVDLRRDLRLTANAIFAEPDLPAGDVFVLSQSGSMIGSLVSRGKALGLGFAGLVSVGGELDLSIGEIGLATLSDPGITGYLLFLENNSHARDLAEFCAGAAALGRPVAAFRVGRSRLAAEIALLHTGALAGDDDVADAFLASCGVARVTSLDGLIDVLPALGRVPARSAADKKPAVAVMTTTGGAAAIIVDQLELRGITVRQPSDSVYAELAAAGFPAAPAPIVDLTLAGTRYEPVSSTLQVLLRSGEFDLVVAVAGSSARLQPELVVAPIIDVAAGGGPVVAFLAPDAPDARARLAAAGVPAFQSPETCADVVAAALGRRVPTVRERHFPGRDEGHAETVTLDEEESYRLLRATGVGGVAAVIAKVSDVLSDPAGIELPFGYPVAVKLLHREVAHKSDVGGVILGVTGPADLARAAASIADTVSARQPGVLVDRLLIQPMAEGIGEVLAGYRRDGSVGPVVVVAAGGVMTEVYRDRSVRLAPVTLPEATQMIDELRYRAVLAGFRGRPRGDMAALAETLVAISRFAAREDVLACEINPLIVGREGTGVHPVDAVAVVRK